MGSPSVEIASSVEIAQRYDQKSLLPYIHRLLIG